MLAKRAGEWGPASTAGIRRLANSQGLAARRHLIETGSGSPPRLRLAPAFLGVGIDALRKDAPRKGRPATGHGRDEVKDRTRHAALQVR